jgi:hypothetical protein
MQQTAFGDANPVLGQSIKYGRNTAEIEVFLLVNQVHMDNFSHNYITFI